MYIPVFPDKPLHNGLRCSRDLHGRLLHRIPLAINTPRMPSTTPWCALLHKKKMAVGTWRKSLAPVLVREMNPHTHQLGPDIDTPSVTATRRTKPTTRLAGSTRAWHVQLILIPAARSRAVADTVMLSPGWQHTPGIHTHPTDRRWPHALVFSLCSFPSRLSHLPRAREVVTSSPTKQRF